MKVAHSLQFCDNCSSLALAVVDSAPLCLGCLLEELKRSPDAHLVDKIRPLPFDFGRIEQRQKESKGTGIVPRAVSFR